MTGWIGAIVLAILAAAAMIVLFRVPRGGREALGAALMFGLAGYGLQGSPSLPAAPKSAPEVMSGAKGIEAIADREKLSANMPMQDRELVYADAFARHGQYADAAGVLRGAVEKNPQNADAWIAMGNAMVAHAEGTISPAAIFAYGRAAAAAPNHPGPPFFLGMAMIESGRVAEGRAIWGDLLARSPKDAPWRADIETRLKAVDAYLARQQGADEAR